jgi:hypothetical protein
MPVRFKLFNEARIDEKENKPTLTDWTAFMRSQRGAQILTDESESKWRTVVVKHGPKVERKEGKKGTG